jgi:hypothetical protein
MRFHRRSIVVVLRLLLTGGALGAVGIACGDSSTDSREARGTSTQDLGTCGPGKMPTQSGGCTTCITNAPGTASDNYLDNLFNLLLQVATQFDGNNNPQSSYYEVLNGVGTLHPPARFADGGSFLGFQFPTPAPQTVSVPGFSGSFQIWPATIGYQVVVTGIPRLDVTWGPWSFGTSGLTINANVSGTIDTHATVDLIGQDPLDPVLNISGLPVTLTFNTDSKGDATVSSVAVDDLQGHAWITNCSIGNICGPIVDGMLGNMTGNLQSAIGNQFVNALNGSGPFWKGLMTALANQGELFDGTYALPAPGTSSAAGTVGTWVFDSMSPITGPSVTGNFTSAGVCFVTCTPMTNAQACSSVSCGSVNDGCGDTVQCPNLCTGADVCDGNYCYPRVTCDPACPAGYMCQIGAQVGVCVINHRCPPGEHFCNNACIPGTGALCP